MSPLATLDGASWCMGGSCSGAGVRVAQTHKGHLFRVTKCRSQTDTRLLTEEPAMNLIITAFEGQLADNPDYTETDNQTPVCTAVVLINRRTKKDGNWTDAEPTRRRIKAWRTNAKKLALLERGNTVVVIGTAETDAWTDKETGEKRTAELVIVDALGKGLLLPRTAEGEHINLVRDVAGE